LIAIRLLIDLLTDRLYVHCISDETYVANAVGPGVSLRSLWSLIINDYLIWD